jgi:hypothetical protein
MIYPNPLSVTPPLPGAVAVPQMNDWFEGLQTAFADSVAPTNPVPGALWFDTGEGVLKRRNAGNTDWDLVNRTEEQLQRLRQHIPMLINGTFYGKSAAFPSSFPLADGRFQIADGWYSVGDFVLVGASAGTWVNNTSQIGHLFPRRLLSIETPTHAAATDFWALGGIRYPDARRFSGQTRSYEFFCDRSANGNISVVVHQHFGTGGTPSADVYTPQKIAVTTALTLYDVVVNIPSVAGKTFGSNDDSYTEVLFYTSAGSNYNAITDSLGLFSGTTRFTLLTDFLGDVGIAAFDAWQPLPLALEKLLAMEVSPIGSMIVESGTNANGTYTKFADGTMIARHNIGANNAADSTWTFPAAFIAAPDVVGSAEATFSNPRIFMSAGQTATTVTFNVVNLSSARTTSRAYMVAYGRWKT